MRGLSVYVETNYRKVEDEEEEFVCWIYGSEEDIKQRDYKGFGESFGIIWNGEVSSKLHKSCSECVRVGS